MPPSLRNIVMLLAVTAVAGSVTAIPEERVEQRIVAQDAAPGQPGPANPGAKPVAGAPGDTATPRASGPATPSTRGAPTVSLPPSTPGLECAAGRNGGSTDTGVTGDSITLASTIVTSGPGATFLGLSRFGLEAVVAKVNAAGGICGRQLRLKLVNDNWESGRGHGYIRNFINDDVFALPVVPSSEGLSAAAQDIENAGIPVVGTDGMRIDQYSNRWIWPVAAATVSQVRIMAKHAYSQGARKFAIVYDTRYKFGVEGKEAYEEYVRSLPGAAMVRAEGIEPGQPGYGPEIRSLNDACNKGCDALVMLVDPGTAEVWISGDDSYLSRSKFRMGASPLFNERFGQNCRERCDGMLVFTGYTPPLEANVNRPGIKAYVDDVKAIKPDADVTNQFLEGAYLGMNVFVEALRRVGPELTRDRLRSVLDSMVYTSDLAGSLAWSGDKRFANTRAQAWSIQAPSSFNGFRDLRTGWLEDPGL